MADLDDLGLGKRPLKILRGAGIEDLDALLERNERELLGLSGFGPGCLNEVKAALESAGLGELAEDPYAAYVCSRHGERSWDTNLANLFLCDDCTATWTLNAFAGETPAYVGPAAGGFCLNCNVNRSDVALRQWFLCGTCERVARSIGRSVVAERFVAEQWKALVLPGAPTLILESTDVPTLRRRGKDDSATKRAEIDFVAREGSDDPAFGFELKTGKSHISGVAGVGASMGEFQLDTSDCDDITKVMEREKIPVYLLHVQVIDRAHPPTVEYKALAGWWTDPFGMSANFDRVQRRPRETRDAAYFKIGMFQPLSTLAHHIENGGPARLAERIKQEGIPALYQRKP